VHHQQGEPWSHRSAAHGALCGTGRLREGRASTAASPVTTSFLALANFVESPILTGSDAVAAGSGAT